MFVAAIFLLTLLFVQSSVAVCPTTAVDVIGASPYSLTSGYATNLYQVLYAVSTSADGNWVYVQGNGLVLRYPVNGSTGAFPTATPVRFGRFPGRYPNSLLTPGICKPSRRAICEPYAVSVDVYNRLWVPDVYLRRVTRWDNVTNATITNPRPSQVYGATTWRQTPVARNTSTSSAYLNSPWYALYQTSSDSLWVLDYYGDTSSSSATSTAVSRLLRYDNVAQRRTFAGPANAYFGTNSFTEVDLTAPAVSAFNFYPGYLALNQALGTLYLSDPVRNRVLVYKNAASKVSGSGADLVIGQANYGASDSGASTKNLNQPQGMSYDSNNDVLYIADRQNSRVVGVAKVSTLTTNGTSFNYLIGQTSYSSHSENRGHDSPTGSTLSYPYDVNYNAATNDLIIADAGNGRVLSIKCNYDPSTTNSRSPSLANSLTRPVSPSHSLTKAASPTHSLTKAPSTSKSPGSGTTGTVVKRKLREQRKYF